MRRRGSGCTCWKTSSHDVEKLLNKPPENQSQSHILICVFSSPSGMVVACSGNVDFCGTVVEKVTVVT